MVCVVCERDIGFGDELYANDWERTRRQYPCCNAACAAAFNDDIHWMPGEQPRGASTDEEQRLASVARRRLLDGDVPTVVARELLVAGMPAPGLRRLLDEAALGAARGEQEDRRQDRRQGWSLLLGWVSWLFLGFGVFRHRPREREKRDSKLVEQAYAAIEQWRLRGLRWKENREGGASARLR
jgi:hypothetical protein